MDFAEIFLIDVRIPIENRVGEENEGWAIAQTTLSAERGLLVFESGERLRYIMERFYADALRNDADWLKNSEMTRDFARLFAGMQGCRRLLRRLLRESEADTSSAAETVIYVKIIASTLVQKVGDFMVRAKGIGGQFYSTATKTCQPIRWISTYPRSAAPSRGAAMRSCAMFSRKEFCTCHGPKGIPICPTCPNRSARPV